jgi:hypothetical protein
MDILLELLGVPMVYGRLIGGGIIMASVLLLIGLQLIIHTFEI